MDTPERIAEQDRRRYARQIILPEFGETGQRRLAASSALLVGLGGLGSPAALYLAAAGVGRLGLVEFDAVDESNLQRQILYRTADAGRPKLEVAAQRLLDLNPGVVLDRIEGPLTATTAREMIAGYDLVLDGTDNFAARYAVNDACVLAGAANVHGAVQGFEGFVTVLAHGDGPCYRCLFPEPPPAGTVPSCAEAGVLGVLPGVVGTLQATEALKLMAGIGEPLVGRMLRFDALAGRFTELHIERDPGCPACGEDPTIKAPQAVAGSCATQPDPPDEPIELPFSIGVEELARRQLQGDAPRVLDVRLDEELALASYPHGVLHIPLHLLPVRFGELERDREYAVICHHGVRSMQAVQFLRAQGFDRARSVSGGIERWSDRVDPTVPRY